jgi:predicted metalloprotease
LHDEFIASGKRSVGAKPRFFTEQIGIECVRDLFGTLSGRTSKGGATGRSVRPELQADCFPASGPALRLRRAFLSAARRGRIADALDAASAVGDDRIQQETQGQVNPETWTHGSSAQRQNWFGVGYKTGLADRCDTFSGNP